MSRPRNEMDRRSALKLIGGAVAGAAISPRMRRRAGSLLEVPAGLNAVIPVI